MFYKKPSSKDFCDTVEFLAMEVEALHAEIEQLNGHSIELLDRGRVVPRPCATACFSRCDERDNTVQILRIARNSRSAHTVAADLGFR